MKELQNVCGEPWYGFVMKKSNSVTNSIKKSISGEVRDGGTPCQKNDGTGSSKSRKMET